MGLKKNPTQHRFSAMFQGEVFRIFCPINHSGYKFAGHLFVLNNSNLFDVLIVIQNGIFSWLRVGAFTTLFERSFKTENDLSKLRVYPQPPLVLIFFPKSEVPGGMISVSQKCLSCMTLLQSWNLDRHRLINHQLLLKNFFTSFSIYVFKTQFKPCGPCSNPKLFSLLASNST